MIIYDNSEDLWFSDVFRGYRRRSVEWIGLIGVPEAVDQKCSVKKVFLEISQNSRENTFARASLLIKLQASSLQLY